MQTFFSILLPTLAILTTVVSSLNYDSLDAIVVHLSRGLFNFDGPWKGRLIIA